MGDVSNEPTMEEILSSIKRVIEDSESAAPARRSRAARTTPESDFQDETSEPLEEVLELSQPAETLEPAVEEKPAPVASLKPETIVSRTAAEASRGSLEALSRMIVKPDVAGSDTLEGLVREMLRPMLRDWLDANLPEIVETMVAKEIARISGRGL